MITGKTKSGFEFELDGDVLDDYELLENLNEVDKGNMGKVVDVVDILLGQEQKERLKEHLRENGRVSAAKIMDEIAYILENVQEVKN